MVGQEEFIGNFNDYICNLIIKTILQKENIIPIVKGTDMTYICARCIYAYNKNILTKTTAFC